MLSNSSVSVNPQLKYFCGIDVQMKRGCCYFVIDDKANFVDSVWSSGKTIDVITYSLHSALMYLGGKKKTDEIEDCMIKIQKRIENPSTILKSIEIFWFDIEETKMI